LYKFGLPGGQHNAVVEPDIGICAIEVSGLVVTVFAGIPLNITLLTDTPWPTSTVFTNCSGVSEFWVVIWPCTVAAAGKRRHAAAMVHKRELVMEGSVRVAPSQDCTAGAGFRFGQGRTVRCVAEGYFSSTTLPI
jgi:hypothetical protein